MARSKKSKSKYLIEFFEMVLIGSGLFAACYLMFDPLIEISGSSMEPNYKNLERVISEKVSLKSTDIKRGEVVVFRDPQTPQIHLIKRVVGIPGDNFKIKEGNVYINNTVLEEPYLAENTQTLEGPVFEEGVDYFVPDNKYILLGDNRGESMDSRTFGYVAKELIESRPVLVVYPLMDIRFLR